MFTTVDGKKTDAPLHEPILKGVNKQSERLLRARSVRRAAERGLSLDALGYLFGKEP